MVKNDPKQNILETMSPCLAVIGYVSLNEYWIVDSTVNVTIKEIYRMVTIGASTV